MHIYAAEDFSQELRKLPPQIKKIFERQEAIFAKNWLDARLHTKRLKELPGAYSFRVTRRYRVIFYFRDDGAVFFSIGHRKDIYR